MEYSLIYINKVGYDYKGSATYEFIFADETVDLEDDVWGEGWEVTPAVYECQPPWEECVSKVGVIKCKDYNLMVAHESEYYSLSDCKDGIIALGYELIDDMFVSYPRLVFHFGESIGSIEDKLKKRNLTLIFDED